MPFFKKISFSAKNVLRRSQLRAVSSRGISLFFIPLLAILNCAIANGGETQNSSLSSSPPLKSEIYEIHAPLFSYTNSPASKGWSFSPFVSSIKDRETDSAEIDVVYPFLTYDRFGQEFRVQFFQLLSFSGGQNMAEEDKKRLTIFPIYFQQRSSNPEHNYTALLPLYGHLKNRFFRDEVNFVLFPLYVETRKRDVVTKNYLLPFFHIRHGKALTGWQIWPLAGFEHKDPTSRTNLLEEKEIIGGHDKMFLLWPFFFKNELGIGTTNQQKQLAVLPLYSSQKSPLRDSTTYLWPFGYTYTHDREKKYREWALPWPLVVFSRGEGKYANRIWPLFGHAKNPILQSDFYFWPVYKYNRATAKPLDRERTRILFFLYSHLIERNTDTGTALRRTDFWPLYTKRLDHYGNESLQVLSLLEPLLPHNKSIARNYSPVWALWRSERNQKSGHSRKSLLWNVYREETTPDTKKCSLLFGLFKYDSASDGKRWRLLNIPIGRRTAKAEASSN